jgi:hypothetical protein
MMDAGRNGAGQNGNTDAGCYRMFMGKLLGGGAACQ